MRTLLIGALLGWTLLPGRLDAQATVSGIVYDSLARRPFAGATVQLVSANAAGTIPRTVEADSAGAFRVDGVAPGRYLVGFMHPRLDSLSMDAPLRTVDVGAGVGAVRADLAIPSARTIATALCGDRHDTTGVLLGRVLDAEGGDAVGAGAVLVRWAEVRVDAGRLHHTPRSVRAAMDENHRYVACGVPVDVPVLVQAEVGDAGRPSGASGEIELTFAPGTPLLHRDLLVGPPAQTTTAAGGGPRVNARLAGHVRRPDGTPFAGARVTVRGARTADSVAVSGADGVFRFDALPGGTYPVEAIGIGFTPARAAVDLRPDRLASVDLALGKPVKTLESVHVYAAAPRANSEFAQHMRQGFGRFITPADIQQRAAHRVSDALAMVPGLQIVGVTSDGRPVFRSRGTCIPTVYLDGTPVQNGMQDVDYSVHPTDIGGIEVYVNGYEAPAQYSRHCAVILVWTKHATL